jgi:hypothetical protein
MINKKSTFFLGIFIFLIPFLGFPSSWKSAFVIISGISLVLMSVKISLPKKGSRIKTKKERTTPVFVENIPIYPKDNTLESNIKSEKKINREVE